MPAAGPAFLLAALLLVVALSNGCDDDRPCFEDALQAHRRELVRCEPGDTCVIAPSSSCHCFGPYNASQQELWDSLRAESTCEGCPINFCPSLVNPRCEEGRCVADEPPPAGGQGAAQR